MTMDFCELFQKMTGHLPNQLHRASGQPKEEKTHVER